MSPNPNPLLARVDALVRQGNIPDAYRLLDTAMKAGDALAAATLADWRLSGQLIRRDLSAARDLFGQASRLGLDEAGPIHIALLANGPGGAPRHWQEALGLLAARAPRDPHSAEQMRLLEAMALTPVGDPQAVLPAQPRHTAPKIETLPSFLSPAECRYLIDLATPSLQPSVVVHPQTGQLVRNPVRSAKSAGFPFVLEDPVLHAINRRIAAATGSTYAQGEPLQVLRYDPGDEYKLHVDALPPGDNQRVTTFLVALNADYQGGQTSFPHVPFDWRGQIGEALHFRNVDASGAAAPLTQHAGRPVQSGVKYLLSKWIREEPLDLSGPPGRPF